MEMLVLVVGGLLAWWIFSTRKRKNLAAQVMGMWVQTSEKAVAATAEGKDAALFGRTVSMLDFQYEYGGVPPLLKVAVGGSGAYLGFRGDITDEGKGMVWFENGSRPAAVKLVKTLCVMYPELVNGNKLATNLQEFIDRYATK